MNWCPPSVRKYDEFFNNVKQCSSKSVLGLKTVAIAIWTFVVSFEYLSVVVTSSVFLPVVFSNGTSASMTMNSNDQVSGNSYTFRLCLVQQKKLLHVKYCRPVPKVLFTVPCYQWGWCIILYTSLFMGDRWTSSIVLSTLSLCMNKAKINLFIAPFTVSCLTSQWLP